MYIRKFFPISFHNLLYNFFDDHKSKYWRFGPHPDFILISSLFLTCKRCNRYITIDTWSSYIVLLILVAFLKISECFIAEVAHPIIGFNIYNPDKKVITEFTKFELQFYGNAMYTIDAIRRVLMIMMSITQVDIALWGVICAEGTSLFTIRMLLNDKEFKPTQDHVILQDDEEQNL